MDEQPTVDGFAKQRATRRSKQPAILLWTLTVLFAVRVMGQVVQRWWPQPYLPPFGAFQGSGLSYPMLLSAQLIILAMMVRTSWRAAQHRLQLCSSRSAVCGWLGGLYWTGSVLRIGIGLTFANAPPWFHAWISEFFHLVLAGFVLTLALCHRAKPARRSLAPVWYPALVISAITGFAALLAAGAPPTVAMYVPVFVVGVAIMSLEPHFAERRQWRPSAADVKTDAAFLLLVQAALPRLLVAGGAITMADWVHDHIAASVWPHDWPLAVQIVIMILLVDFLRYWLHRACHRYQALWRLHEVHHSPRLLYTLNVGRFHPFEKTLHTCLDTAPFLAVGVAAPVIAGYFLLYSINGFFQHSNLKLRYGALNYLVGSAETHRWHHARNPLSASCNFSNTTIVWDLAFGTWYLPPGKSVGEVGLQSRQYPSGFMAQMIAPFRRNNHARR